MPQIFTQKSPKNHPKSLQNVTQNQKKNAATSQEMLPKSQKKNHQIADPIPDHQWEKVKSPNKKSNKNSRNPH